VDLQKQIHCLRCNQFQHSKNFIEICYKLLIKEHNHKIRKEEEFFNLMKTYALNPIEVRNANEEENEILRNLKRGNLFYIKSDNDKIPVLLRRLHPRLSNKEYMEIKDLMEFQEHKILICQDCYMELLQYLQHAGGQENLLEMIKIKAKRQKHKSSDLSIKKLEVLKKPFYQENKQMHDKMKSVCSYIRQKRCGASLNFNAKSELIANPVKNPQTVRNFSKNNTLNFLNYGVINGIIKKDPYQEQVDSLVEIYGENKESAFKRIENRINPKVIEEKSKNMRIKYPSLHQFHLSMDSTKTNITKSNKSEKNCH